MPPPTEARTLTVTIRRPAREVYDFVADPRNLPRWARGLGSAVRRSGEDWIVDTAGGPARIAFAPRNDLGVADHRVTPPDGAEILVPLRVVPNGDGSEVLLTVFAPPGAPAGALDADARLVERDLGALKACLEAGA